MGDEAVNELGVEEGEEAGGRASQMRSHDVLYSSCP